MAFSWLNRSLRGFFKRQFSLKFRIFEGFFLKKRSFKKIFLEFWKNSLTWLESHVFGNVGVAQLFFLVATLQQKGQNLAVPSFLRARSGSLINHFVLICHSFFCYKQRLFINSGFVKRFPIQEKKSFFNASRWYNQVAQFVECVIDKQYIRYQIRTLPEFFKNECQAVCGLGV